MLKFKKHYFILAILLFITEVLIALFVHDKIIRPYIGDFLVVILLYCFLRSFLNTAILPTALSVLLFSFAIEILQYFNIVQLLGLQRSTVARIVIGSSFEWTDLFLYTAGILTVLLTEKIVNRRLKIS